MANNSRLVVLKRRSDFQNIFKNGQRIRPNSWLLFNYLSNDLGYLRCGWTIPRKVGSAVIRNRLKRWSREYLRKRVEMEDPISVDLNLVFRKMEGDFYKTLTYEQFSKGLEKGWRLLTKKR